MPTLTTLLTFGAASIALLLIPGPAVLYIVNRSVADGRRVGLASVAGVEIGTLVHVIAAALGLSAALAASAIAFSVIKWLGAAYLIVLGIRTLATRPSAVDLLTESISPRRAFVQGIVVNVLNPKIALFFLSFLPQFVEPDRGNAVAQTFVLGLVFVSLGTLSDGMFSLVASALRGVLVHGRALAVVRRYVAGTIYISLGLVAGTTGHASAAQQP